MKDISDQPTDQESINTFIITLTYLIGVQKLSKANVENEIDNFVANFPESVKSQLAQEIRDEIEKSEIIIIENPFA